MKVESALVARLPAASRLSTRKWYVVLATSPETSCEWLFARLGVESRRRPVRSRRAVLDLGRRQLVGRPGDRGGRRRRLAGGHVRDLRRSDVVAAAE